MSLHTSLNRLPWSRELACPCELRSVPQPWLPSMRTCTTLQDTPEPVYLPQQASMEL